MTLLSALTIPVSILYTPLALITSILTHFKKPILLEELFSSQDDVKQKLDAQDASALEIEEQSYADNEAYFRFAFNEDAMASEKLREGILKFAADALTLKDILKMKTEGTSS